MEERLIDKEGSTVLIVRGWLQEEEATSLCNKLREEVAWRQDPVVIRGKSIMQPRRIYACGDDGVGFYTYSGLTIPVETWIEEVKTIRDRIQTETSIVFDSCLLNEYQDGKSYIGYHSDKEAMGANNAVVTVSLGGSRDFYFKTKTLSCETIQTTLHNGDVCIMSGTTQRDYTHSIPKRAHGEYRISLTYRLIKA